jgi:peptidoglycan hydrolase CwlO-like protein
MVLNSKIKYIVLVTALFCSLSLLHAQTAGDVLKRRAELQQELDRLEVEIAEQETILNEQKGRSASLERDINILNAEIEKSKLSIRARDIAIAKLSTDISGKIETIDGLNTKIIREKASLAQLIRKTNEKDSFTVLEIILAHDNLSDFFSDLDSFDDINKALNQSFVDITATKQNTSQEKVILEDKREEELELRTLQELEKRKIEEQENEKKNILAISKGIEAGYQKVLESKERTAAEIRSELFTLRDSGAIPFGQALDLADQAGARTGVRPAFILGVIAEESNLGENVGTGNWRTDMHPDRDVPVFLKIAEALGLNPDTLPVSKKPWYGWGGAMGPAQFIPSTWAIYGGYDKSSGYEYDSKDDQIRKILSLNRVSNPWEPLDAFTASSILLADNGADGGTRADERLAALRYFAGWKNATNPSYAFYGDEVMALAEKYQKQIDILNNS